MPLIRAAALPQAGPLPSPQSLLAQLEEAEPAQRRAAARQLGHGAPADAAAQHEAAAALAAQLLHEADAAVREALFGALVELGGAEVAGLLERLLHHADAALRNGALAALKQLGDAAAPVVETLLTDADPVVRLLAADVLRDWPCSAARPLLAARLAREADANACGALFDIVIAQGDPALLPELAACAARFPAEPFLQFALNVAVAALGSTPGDVA